MRIEFDTLKKQIPINKTGYSDDGPAWIGKVTFSKSGQTVYFNNKGFKKCGGIFSNHYDIETNEEYWISGIKKNGEDRHWAGSGKITIDKKVVEEYLQITGQKSIDTNKYFIVEIPNVFPIERINEAENKQR